LKHSVNNNPDAYIFSLEETVRKL